MKNKQTNMIVSSYRSRDAEHILNFVTEKTNLSIDKIVTKIVKGTNKHTPHTTHTHTHTHKHTHTHTNTHKHTNHSSFDCESF